MLVEFLAQIGVTEHPSGAHHSTDQTLRKRTVVRFTTAQQDGDQAPFSICECMDLRVAPSARTAHSLLFLPRWDCRALAPPAHDKVPCGTAHASERLPTLDPLPDWQSIDRRNFSVRHEYSPWGSSDGEDPPGGYCVVKIAFGIMPWIPLVPSTTCVTW
jgi:hypothetical protein